MKIHMNLDYQQKTFKMDKKEPQAGEFWHVVYECRDTIVEVVKVTKIKVDHIGNRVLIDNGLGFYAFGQDAIWDLSAAAEWIQEVVIERN
jgi:hypothetical protein